MKIPTKWAWLSGLSVALVCVGCCAPPLLFPKTGGHGVVVDQHNQPVTNASIKASYDPVRFLNLLGFPAVTPVYVERFHVKEDGTWRYYVRKANTLSIEAEPLEGYEGTGTELRMIQLHLGQCPTNTIIFRMQKLEPATNAVPTTGKTEAK